MASLWMPDCSSERITSLTIVCSVVEEMLMLAANPARSWEQLSVIGEQEEVVVLRDTLGDDAGDQGVGGQGDVVAVLFEAACLTPRSTRVVGHLS